MVLYGYLQAIYVMSFIALTYLRCFVLWDESSFFFAFFRQCLPQQTGDRNKPVETSLWPPSTHVCSLFVRRPGW